MKIYRLWFLILALFTSAGMQAQAKLVIDPHCLDTFQLGAHFLGSTIDIPLTVTDTGTYFSPDTVFIHYALNGVVHNLPDANSGISYLLDTLSIAPGGSIVKILHFSFNGPNFIAGVNVLTIWPFANTAITVDSVTANIVLINPPAYLFIDTAVLVDSLQPSYHLGNSDSVLVTINNTGNLPFGDTLYFDYSINGVLYSGPQSPGISYPLERDSIAAHGSMTKMLHFDFTGPAFIAGPSVVVIWPRASYSVAQDSARITLQILAPNSISSIGQEKVIVYMAGRQLLIAGSGQLKEVKIYNVQGALLLQQEISTDSALSMQPFAAGIYLVEVILEDNSKKTFKVLNTGW